MNTNVRQVLQGWAGTLPSRQPACTDARWVMMRMMRLTISMADRLAEDVRREAGARGLSVSAFIARIVDDALKPPEPTHAKPFRLITVGGGGPRPGVTLDRPRELETREDEARYP